MYLPADVLSSKLFVYHFLFFISTIHLVQGLQVLETGETKDHWNNSTVVENSLKTAYDEGKLFVTFFL